MTKISIKNQIFFYEIRRQARKSFYLELTAPDHLLIKAPPSMPDNEIQAYIKKKEHWLLERNNLLKSSQTPTPMAETVPFMGKQYRLDITQSMRRPTIKIVDDTLRVNLYAPRAVQFPLLLERWYLRQAADYLKNRTDFWSTRLGTTVNRIAIKDQKTRWGSCSSLGNINYNWRLIMAPPEIINYIVTHEVAHRLVLNHSKQFWDIVSYHCPDHEIHKTWLKTHGNSLLNFSVPKSINNK